MPDIATALKAEIARLARKEVRDEVASMRSAVTQHRRDIAALKRQVLALERQLRQLAKATPVPASTPTAADAPTRFSAKGLAAHRQRLGLSADDLGRLLGASGQSVYNWEAGTVRPRARHMPALTALRSLGKKDAAAVLAGLKAVA